MHEIVGIDLLCSNWSTRITQNILEPMWDFGCLLEKVGCVQLWNVPNFSAGRDPLKKNLSKYLFYKQNIQNN